MDNILSKGNNLLSSIKKGASQIIDDVKTNDSSMKKDSARDLTLGDDN